MFTHVFLGSNDIEKSRKFYDATMATLGFSAADDATVDAWHAAGLEAGGTDEGGPGPREAAPNNARGAYLRDPDGNKVCAFNMGH